MQNNGGLTPGRGPVGGWFPLVALFPFRVEFRSAWRNVAALLGPWAGNHEEAAP